MFSKKKESPHEHEKRSCPHTQLITGMHAAHTTWRLLRWLLFLAALLSIVCGGFLLSVKSAEVRYQFQTLKIEKEAAEGVKVDIEQAKSIATTVATAFRKYWILLVLILAGIFTFFELFIHSRWKIYAIYAVLAIASWVFVLYAMNLLELPEELVKAGGGG